MSTTFAHMESRTALRATDAVRDHGKPNKVYPAGRVCVRCPAILSRYNPDDICQPCAVEMEAEHAELRHTEHAPATPTQRRKRDQKIHDYVAQGWSKSKVAREFDLSYRRVKQVLDLPRPA